MALGMVPAVIALILVGAAIALLAVNASAIGAWLTPFATNWDATAGNVARELAGALVVVGAAVLAFYTFTTLTLLIGEPFYERIWRRAEQDLGGFPSAPLTFWRSAGGGVALVLRGAAYALLTLAVGLVPVAGPIIVPLLGAVLAGHLIARELTTRPLENRGVAGNARRAVRRGSRARQLGFGVMTQLFFLVPGGAILVMPAAVVGSTLLVRQMLERTALSAQPPAPPSAPPSAPPRPPA